MDHKVLLDLLDLLDLPDLLVLLDPKDHKGQREMLVHKDLRELQDLMVYISVTILMRMNSCLNISFTQYSRNA